MRYTKLGRTGPTVSRVALGCAPYGNNSAPVPGEWAIDIGGAGEHFRRALDLGINYFDTADKYSNGASEEIVGHWLGKLANREDIVVSTKAFDSLGGGPDEGGLGRKHILAACDASLRRLNMDYVDVYSLHHWDFFTPIEETLDALGSLVRQGKVRFVGTSSFSAWQLARCHGGAALSGLSRPIVHSCHYNLVYREAEEEIIPLCIDQGVGVTAWSPLARGVLAESRRSATPSVRALSDRFSDDYDAGLVEAIYTAAASIAQLRGVSTSQIALAWVLQSAGMDAAIVGCTKVSQIEQAAAASELELSPEEMSQLEAPYPWRKVIGHDQPTPRQLLEIRGQSRPEIEPSWIRASRLTPRG